jgi:hypothetical protein
VLSNVDQPGDSLDDEVVQNHLQSRKSAMTAITDFDPDAFLVVPARTFEDLRIGEVFRAPSRTLTDAHAAAFQTVSMFPHFIGEVSLASRESTKTTVPQANWAK